MSAGLSPTLPSPALWPPSGGTFLTFLSFPRPRVAESPLPAGQRLGSPDFSTAPRPLPASVHRSGPPSRGDSLGCLPGGSHKSPPLCRPARRSGAGALCRATRQEHPRDRGGSRAERVENMEPSRAQAPRATHRGAPPSPAGGQRAETILGRHARVGARPGQRGPELSPRPGALTRTLSLPTRGPAGPALRPACVPRRPR